ncbi:MAG: ribokinase [Clostridia bacterium]|nr:ribokinase [Clostridia bacterium]
MKILVFGSLNIDRTYRVAHFVSAGETLSAQSMELYCGGKGFNQAIALSRAGNQVYFAGAVGEDGQMLIDALAANGIDCRHVLRLPCSTGHAVIQVEDSGQNCIIILAGANGMISVSDIDHVLAYFSTGDMIVLQNEISHMPELLEKAHQKGMLVALNPAPMNASIAACRLENVDYLLLNETEGAELAGCRSPDDILAALHTRYPQTHIVLTLGEDGAMFQDTDGGIARVGIFPVQTVDTTAAGDTFTGYFLSEIVHGCTAQEALRTAAAAAGLAVTKQGAEPSIPYRKDVMETLKSFA